MTPTTMQDVSKVIESMLQEKTLSLDAMEGIRALKDRADKADQEIIKLTERYNTQSGRNAQLESDLSDAREKLDAIAAREAAVAKREAAVHQLEMKAAVAQAESAAYRTSLGIVFAPNIVREQIMKYGSVSNGNGMTVPTSDTGSVQHVEGYAHPGAQDSAGGTGSQAKPTL